MSAGQARFNLDLENLKSKFSRWPQVMTEEDAIYGENSAESAERYYSALTVDGRPKTLEQLEEERGTPLLIERVPKAGRPTPR